MMILKESDKGGPSVSGVARSTAPFCGRGMDGKSYKFGTSVVPAIRRGVAADKLAAAAADKAV